MKKAREDGMLPDEAYAIAGTSATEATLTRTLWCDVNRLQHKSHAIVSADLGQCYDSIAWTGQICVAGPPGDQIAFAYNAPSGGQIASAYNVPLATSRHRQALWGRAPLIGVSQGRPSWSSTAGSEADSLLAEPSTLT